MKALAFSAALFLALPMLGQKPATLQPVTVRIDANQWNQARLLEKLNQNDAKHGITFALADQGYQYRISFNTGKASGVRIQNGKGWTEDYDTGLATVYDSQGEELFQVQGRWDSEAGAINGTAKQIIKRLTAMSAQPAKKQR